MNYQKYTDEQLIKILQDFNTKEKRPPSVEDFKNRYPNASTFMLRFGSWLNALRIAGIKKEKFSKNGYTDKELINELKRYYRENNKVPVTRDFKNNKDYPNPQTYSDRFGSWKQALKLADLYDLRKDIYQFCNQEYSTDELLLKLNEYIKENGLPTAEDFRLDPTMPSYSTYVKRFGGLNIAIEMLGYNPLIKREFVSKEKMISDLRKLWKELGRTPTSRDMEKCPYTSASKSYSEKFGSIYKALDAANIPYKVTSDYYTEKEIIDMWYDLKSQLNRIPTTIDMENYETVNLYSAIQVKWDTYTNFLELIGEDQNFNKYGCKIYATKNGTRCLSSYELMITQWLEDNHIEFEKEVFYSTVIKDDNTQRRFDWVIDYENKIYYVEMFGVINRRGYKEKTQKKILDCKRNGIELIALYPKDLKKPLNEVFSFLIKESPQSEVVI